MGEGLEIIAIEIIEQPEYNRTLLQIDLRFTETDKHCRTFIETDVFFQLLNKGAK